MWLSRRLIMSVGIRELKNRLSHYLKIVKGGEKLAISDRGRIVAYITPAGNAEYEGLIALVREGKASWKGGKPSGSKKPVRVSGRPISQIILEERR